MHNLPKLTPITSKWMHEILAKKGRLENLFNEFGSPLNLHFLPEFDRNISAFKKTLDNFGIKNQLFYARKANKSKSLVDRAHKNGIGVDTASFRELQQCLGLGLPPKNLVLTAAIKNEKLLRFAAKNNVLIILDNEDECKLLQQIAEKLKISVNVGFRISGFIYKNEKLYSRFGFDISEIETFLNQHLGKEKTFKNLHFTGFHFHLDGYSTEQRGEALLQTLAISERIQENGFTTEFIDIGGGILMNYLQSESEWNNFQEELKKAVKNEREEITFNNNGLGFEIVEKKLQGKLATYPYFNTLNKENFLEKILQHTNENDSTVAEILKEKNIELRLEPGRSLLDQVGLTLAKVAFRKKDSKGRNLIGLEMNMSQLQSSSADFLLDPIVVNFEEKPEDKTEVYFVSGYCLERDVVLKRKIEVNQLPEIGDVVAFINTAGYMMHFFETQAHLFELSTNLAIDRNSENNFKIKADEEF
ncbi:Y4yA family PLP-dependent enzyme [Mesonia maritima]|uniref:Diaminopimelate decarboxylase n=1 Tax=Mesonia maritima TaxID=1793873 RepID=A0ABU1K7H9_9FLAO|nr:Y4yA family PLP-dependent enzyme [Mesonia maritima]MDR6301582.1 diaminopimelate decarboxylase [Mesonia maritima]